MTLDLFREFLGWCTLINWAMLLLWFGCFSVGHESFYRFHSRYFELSREKFDEIHYQGMAGFKLLILVFNFVPYLVLRIFV